MTQAPMPSSRRLMLSLAVFLAWILVTTYGARILSGGVEQSLIEGIKSGVAWNIVAAAALVLLAAAIWKWRDLGFVAPRPGTLKLLWFPGLYLVGFAALALLQGLPPASVIFFFALNCLFVGLSEEGMCRGILFRGLWSKLRLWPSIIISSLLFGSMHVLNVFTTGQIVDSAMQATAATLSGFVFMMIVIRTGSILPAIAYHGLWDFLAFNAGYHENPALNADGLGAMKLFVPVLMVLPNFLYAAYLMRNVKDEPPTGTAA